MPLKRELNQTHLQVESDPKPKSDPFVTSNSSLESIGKDRGAQIRERPEEVDIVFQLSHYMKKYSDLATRYCSTYALKIIKIINYSNKIIIIKKTTIFPFLKGAKSIPEILSHS